MVGVVAEIHLSVSFKGFSLRTDTTLPPRIFISDSLILLQGNKHLHVMCQAGD